MHYESYAQLFRHSVEKELRTAVHTHYLNNVGNAHKLRKVLAIQTLKRKEVQQVNAQQKQTKKHIYISLSLFLSLSLYIYIYMFTLC